jgi:hypothetical protein
MSPRHGWPLAHLPRQGFPALLVGCAWSLGLFAVGWYAGWLWCVCR